MRVPAACALILLAGCASAPAETAPVAKDRDAPSPGEEIAGLPLPVVVERALFDLDSGDPERGHRARCVLRALPGGPALDPLRRRVAGHPPGSEERLEALALLAARGERVEGISAGERVRMNLREIARGSRGAFAELMAVARLRSMGEEGVALLDEVLRDAETDPRARAAAAVLAAIHGLDRRLPGFHP